MEGRGNNSRNNSPAASSIPGFALDAKGSVAGAPPGFDIKPLGNELPLEELYDANLLQHVDREVLGPHDRNRNGILDSDEWEGVPWADSPRQDDKDRDGRLTRAELAARLARVWGYGEKRADGNRGPGARGKAPWDNAEGKEARVREYAETLMRQYDANRNGTLEREEWKNMNGNWDPADRNRDGHLTIEELIARAGGDASNSPRVIKPIDTNLSYRTRPAQDRLPKGLPEWFTRKDTNADGQVAMAEWTTAWTDTEFVEYQKHDINGDGFITADEVVAAKRKPEERFGAKESTVPGQAFAKSRPEGSEKTRGRVLELSLSERMERAERGSRPERGDRGDREDRGDQLDFSTRRGDFAPP